MEPERIFKGQSYAQPMHQELKSGGKLGPEPLVGLQRSGVGFPFPQKLFIGHISLEAEHVDPGQNPNIPIYGKSMGKVEISPGMKEDPGIVLQKSHPKAVVGIDLMEVVHKE